MTNNAYTPGDWTRTLGEARLDLDYAIAYVAMNQRFYGRVHKGIAFASLLCGSAAFVSVFHPNSAVVAAAGLAIGVMALAEQVYDFRGKEADNARSCKAYMQLKARSAAMQLDALDKSIDKISADATPAMQGLRKPAYNENMRRNGFVDRQLPLNAWERILDAVI